MYTTPILWAVGYMYNGSSLLTSVFLCQYCPPCQMSRNRFNFFLISKRTLKESSKELSTLYCTAVENQLAVSCLQTMAVRALDLLKVQYWETSCTNCECTPQWLSTQGFHLNTHNWIRKNAKPNVNSFGLLSRKFVLESNSMNKNQDQQECRMSGNSHPMNEN